MQVPHLPPKTCHVAWHKRLQSLPGLLVVMALSGLMGAICSLIVVGWIVPSFIPEQTIHRFTGVEQTTETNNPTLEAHVRERQLRVFDRSKRLGTRWYNSKQAHLFNASLLSANGWSVMYRPTFRYGEEWTWDLLDSQNNTLRLERSVFDRHTGLLYLKVAAEDFRVFSFVDWGAQEHPMNAWMIHDEGAVFEQLLPEQVAPIQHRSFAAQQSLLVPETSTFADAVVLNQQGALLGLADQDGKILPSFWVQEHLTKLLEGERLAVKSLPIIGSFVDTDAKGESDDAMKQGFYVVRSYRGLWPGDVIVRVNDAALDPVRLPHTLLTSDEQISLTVLRGKEEITIDVPKQIIR